MIDLSARPRCLQDIVDHADELANRFEAFDLDRAAQIPVDEYLSDRASEGSTEGDA